MDTAAATRQPRFLPTDPRPDPTQALARSVTRAATAEVLNSIKSPHERVERIVEEHWAGDRVALHVLSKSATAPATTTTSGWAAELAVTTTTAAFLVNLPVSAASQLFARALSLPLDNVASIKIPYPNPTPSLSPSFTAEGAPIPARQASVVTVTLGPSRKLAVLTGLTNELAEHSVPVAEALIRQILIASTSAALDTAVFSATAASASQPAGLLNGVAPLTATTGGGQAALLGDIALLAAAISAAGGTRMMLFVPPAKAAVIPVYAPGFAVEVVPTPALAPATVVAIDPDGVVSGTSGQPRVDVGKSTTVHYDDTNPLQISTPGSPNVVAAPVRSAFQTDSFVLRLLLDCSWAARPGFVQYVASVTW